jgi:hypothetical protein
LLLGPLGTALQRPSELIHNVADRLANRLQLTTDGHKPYLGAVEEAFRADIDYAMLVKTYGESDQLYRKAQPDHAPTYAPVHSFE